MITLVELAIGILVLAVASLILGVGLKMIKESSSKPEDKKDDK